jgi:urease accessory protein
MWVRRAVLVGASGIIVIAAGPASAHSGTGIAGGFVAGLQHPVFGPDHLLAMVAVGLWGAFLGRPLIVVLPTVFPIVMAVGGVLGMAALPFPPVELGIALSVIIFGAVIGAGLRAPVWAAAALVGLFALFHGYAHGQELPSAADPTGYSIGFVLATGGLHLLGIALGILRDRGGGVVLIRALGCLIALCGVWFLVQALGG